MTNPNDSTYSERIRSASERAVRASWRAAGYDRAVQEVEEIAEAWPWPLSALLRALAGRLYRAPIAKAYEQEWLSAREKRERLLRKVQAPAEGRATWIPPLVEWIPAPPAGAEHVFAPDDERLAVLLEGKMASRERDAALSHLAGADADYEVFTDTAGALHALEDQDAERARALHALAVHLAACPTTAEWQAGQVADPDSRLAVDGLILQAREITKGRGGA